MSQSRAVIVFLALLAALCAGFVALMLALGQRGYYLAQAYMLTPALAVIVTRVFFYRPKFSDARLGRGRGRDYARFWAFGLAIVVLNYVLYTLLGAVRWDLSGRTFLSQLAEQMAATGQDINDLPPGFTPEIMLGLYVLGGLTIFNVLPGMITGLGEEAGWRDFLFPLLYRQSPRMAIAGGGLIWFAWHAVLIPVLPQTQTFSPAEWAANVTVLASGSICTWAILAYVYVKSGSVFVVAFFHAVLNNASRAFSYFVTLDNQLLANMGLAFAAALVVAMLYWRGEFRVFSAALGAPITGAEDTALEKQGLSVAVPRP
jgi:uncharacterized protein